MANGLDPDQDQCSVSPDLSQNCLQRLLADEKRKELNFVARPNVQDHNFVLEIEIGMRAHLSCLFLYPATLKSVGYYVIISIQKIASECRSVSAWFSLSAGSIF